MSSSDRCEIFCFDEKKVNRVQSQLDEIDFESTVTIFKALGDPTRIKIAFALTQEEELCVCDVANIIGSSLATASHHLRLLRNLGIAGYRKEGKLVFYSLKNKHLGSLIPTVLEHQQEEVVSNG
ncbi:ArsR/SmtB family transcription factor [Halobacillus amylolyticus]|uniref:Metalloregulator ArsR/SmtB family transcription factor n=1 Tax=Halobacillus amylolyticus TaxID=2932259 RepID=A0ABY4HDX5_9BACI|nr:metalloregulator ArsR/SmtB family transcription factor [Halobacillus amylolyticus]UOR12105.1 metalloregulator ArsR/SmtB family transcription factor [Halobacillus amylolyticus]